MSVKNKVMSYGELKEKVFSVIGKENKLMGDYISNKSGTYWLVGEKLAWFAEEVLDNLALEIRQSGEKQWSKKDLVKMFKLHLRYPTVANLSGRCIGRKQDMTLDELLDIDL